MKSKEMTAIVGQQDPALSSCECKDFVIWHGSVRPSGFERCQYVVSEPPKLHDNLQRNVLV